MPQTIVLSFDLLDFVLLLFDDSLQPFFFQGLLLLDQEIVDFVNLFVNAVEICEHSLLEFSLFQKVVVLIVGCLFALCVVLLLFLLLLLLFLL